jgi:short-subunit dehydrogenase
LGFGVKWCPSDVWAVITDTDGIGLQYAKQLAAKEYSIFFVSRDENFVINFVTEKLKVGFDFLNF